MSNSLLYSYLKFSGIEEYHSKFVERGIDLETMMNLSMHEIFQKTEIVQKEARRKIFDLKEYFKENQDLIIEEIENEKKNIDEIKSIKENESLNESIREEEEEKMYIEIEKSNIEKMMDSEDEKIDEIKMDQEEKIKEDEIKEENIKNKEKNEITKKIFVSVR
jgi:hypothetical protein